MSFYNVSNPSTFSVETGNKIAIVAQGKMQRTPSTQLLTPSAAFTITAQQLIAGYLLINPQGASRTGTLPSATDLITLLMGPGGFDISNSDIFSFRVQNLNAGGNNAVITAGTGGSGTVTVVPGANKPVLIQITITTVAGTTTYGYRLLNL
jgi:hypothetical protein